MRPYVNSPPETKTGAITDREICQSLIVTAHLFLYLVDEGIAVSTNSRSRVNRFRLPKSCLSIYTHGQTPTTPKQLIMQVEVMLRTGAPVRNMARSHRCVHYCSFIWGGQYKKCITTYFFYCFVWEVISKTRASGFIRGSNHLETKSTRPAASCFHLFLGVWNPWWNPRTRFWYITWMFYPK